MLKSIDINNLLCNELHNLSNIQSPVNNKLIIDCNLADIKKICQSYGFTTLLSESKSQTKLGKTEKELNILPYGLSLAPFTLNGVKEFSNNLKQLLKYDISNSLITLCSNSSVSCRNNCVIWNSGNPAYQDAKQNAMIKRVRFLLDNPLLFIACVLRLLELKKDYCFKNRYIMSYRGNIASDIKYENIRVNYSQYQNVSIADIFYKFIQETTNKAYMKPYDYTKHYDRIPTNNYHFIYSVHDLDDKKLSKAYNNGLSLAIVIDTPANKEKPKFMTLDIDNKQITLPCVDGDKHDHLPTHLKDVDNKQHIVLLSFKYKAVDKKETRIKKINNAILNGFVRQVA